MNLKSWLSTPRRPAMLMGVLNLTPDSFSDGGQYNDPQLSVDRALQMVAQGAGIIDVGGESTRPGAVRIPAPEQIVRIIPTIRAIARQSAVPVSVDTTLSDVAEAALDAGAQLINDISAGREDPAILDVVARHSAPVVLMHMLGTPATMQQAPTYGNVVQDVKAFLQKRILAALDAGIPAEQILIDPGIGFGKNIDHNLSLLRHLSQFKGLASGLLVGTSRKSFIGTLTNKPEATERQFGTAGTVAWSIAQGADILRIHDVAEMQQVLQVVNAIMAAT